MASSTALTAPLCGAAGCSHAFIEHFGPWRAAALSAGKCKRAGCPCDGYKPGSPSPTSKKEYQPEAEPESEPEKPEAAPDPPIPSLPSRAIVEQVLGDYVFGEKDAALLSQALSITDQAARAVLFLRARAKVRDETLASELNVPVRGIAKVMSVLIARDLVHIFIDRSGRYYVLLPDLSKTLLIKAAELNALAERFK